ncbi:beta-glucanase [Grosmannia clavigera kw1407]|uniref:glucan endo-1,3-beta-D-glucosidase n=1 Tax=Grosmannia clavigera (strain kw1407 / UAMH 11150) TaxID=655863 RepID=F0XHN3_GROCL|nr:beta-glucanase [Grosmannia clavigera kw1407]EFX02744.1 beta-glucanase [Grosmannia clavigera kw1407]
MDSFEELAGGEPPIIDPYAVLGLERAATADQVKTAYRKAALRCHPDKVSEDCKAAAHEEFQAVALAYAVLSDVTRRKRYDATGSTAESMLGLDGDDDTFSWSDFYRAAFADAVSASAIEQFAQSYRRSDEERADVLAAYERAHGRMDDVYESVMLSSVLDDDVRFRAIIDAAIAAGDVSTFSAYTAETKRSRTARVAEARRENKEAEQYARELGVHDKLFGQGEATNNTRKTRKTRNTKTGADDDQAGLAALIQKRQQDRSATFLDSLAAKYGATEPKTKAGKGRKRTAADEDDGEPSEEAFQAAAARLKSGKAKSTKRTRRGIASNASRQSPHVPGHAMTETRSALVYYPQYCFHLAPTLNKWCPLRLADVQRLATRAEFEGQNVYFHRNYPLKWVRVAGVVVACDEYYGRLVYTIDDGSGATTECVTKREADPGGKPAGTDTAPEEREDLPGLQVGQVVGVKGELRQFRDLLQVQIVQIVRLRSTEDEVRFWAKTQAFAGVLGQPWVLGRRVVQQCREAAEKKTSRPAERKKTARSRRRKQDVERETSPPPKRPVPDQTAAVPPEPPKKWSLGSGSEAVASGSTAQQTTTTAMDIFATPVATTPPPAQIRMREDHPLACQGVDRRTRQASGPLQTNKFYANLLLGEQDFPVYMLPYSVSWTKGRSPTCGWGLTVSHVTAEQRVFGPPAAECRHDTASGAATAAGYYFSPPIVQNIVLDAAELGDGTTLAVEDLTHMSATVSVRPAGQQRPAVQFPLVQGQAFVTGLYDGSRPVVRSAMAITSVDGLVPDAATGGAVGSGQAVVGRGGAVRRFVLQLNDGATWFLYARHRPGTTPLVLQRTAVISVLEARQPFCGLLQVARAMPEPGGSMGLSMLVYDRSAGVYATGVMLSGRTAATDGQADRSDGSYRFGFAKAPAVGGNDQQNTPLLIFALPHHRASFDQQTRVASTYLQLQTPTNGIARAVAADAWTMVEPELPVDMGFLPWDPQTRRTVRSLSSAAVRQTIWEVARQELAQDMDAQSNLDSVYFSGKGLAKFATIVLCARELLGDEALAAAGLRKLQAAFARFAENRQRHPLVYESAWGGLVSSATYTTGDAMADFGNAYYNDHHFHYGYLVYAGAVLGHLDGAWLRTHGAYVDTLVRDYANPSRQDGFFPVFRSFDWYHGHSWAHGLFAAMDGKDQESSSEDGLAAYAIKLWGQVRGDVAMEARGSLMLAVLARSLQTYYYYEPNSRSSRDDGGHAVVPAAFAANRVVGILMENKMDHTTYFGAAREYIHGIHMLPLLPCSPLIRPPSFVAEEWTDAFGHGRADAVAGGWRGVLYGNLATADPGAAYAFFSQPAFDPGWLDGGASRTWYLCYAAALQEGGGRWAR